MEPVLETIKKIKALKETIDEAYKQLPRAKIKSIDIEISENGTLCITKDQEGCVLLSYEEAEGLRDFLKRHFPERGSEGDE